ncbi:diacylglyceryl transferase [Providencia heimbachae]|nr:diacylglyceryl transferase [Providencia heimbachae]
MKTKNKLKISCFVIFCFVKVSELYTNSLRKCDFHLGIRLIHFSLPNNKFVAVIAV